jgi:hypothetical protein
MIYNILLCGIPPQPSLAQSSRDRYLWEEGSVLLQQLNRLEYEDKYKTKYAMRKANTFKIDHWMSLDWTK